MKTGPKGPHSQKLIESSQLILPPPEYWLITPQDIANHAIDELMEEEDEGRE